MMKEKELLSIKEFSRRTAMRQSVLRHYDFIGLFRPNKRGENGYRYYSPEQITDIKMINTLCNIKTSLREIMGFRRNRDPKIMLDHLQKQEEKFDSEMRNLQEAYSVAHAYRRLINDGLTADENTIVERDLTDMPIYIGSENRFRDQPTYHRDFTEFCREARENNVNLSYPVGGIFADMNVFLRDPSHPANFFSTDPHGNSMRGSGHYIMGYVRGDYGTTGDMPERMLEYAKEHDLEFHGPVFVVYVLDEICLADPDNYLAQIYVKVQKKTKHAGAR